MHGLQTAAACRRCLATAAVVLAVAALAPQPALADRPAERAPQVGYGGGFVLTSDNGDFALNIQGGLQLQFRLLGGESRPTDPAFLVRRGRLTLEGHAYDPAIEYKFQAAFDRGVVDLKDYFVQFTLVDDAFAIRVGQAKLPFSRQFINSGFDQEFVGRALTHDHFAARRDIGLTLMSPDSQGLEYAVGLYNGSPVTPTLDGAVRVDATTGDGEIVEGGFDPVPARWSPALAARLAFNRGAGDTYTEADLRGGPLRWGVGASSVVYFDSDGDDESSVHGELDFAAKAHGASTSGAVYLATEQAGPDFANQGFDRWGAHIQGGYTFDRRVQLAARWAGLRYRAPNPDVDQVELALSYYFREHGLKWQTDGGVRFDRPDDDTATTEHSWQVRSHIQIEF